MAGLIRYVGKRVRRLHKWEPDISTVAWAEKNIYLGSDASPLSGMMRFDETPYLEQVLNDSDRPEVWLQALCWSTQTGKALCETTPLLTPTGWTTLKALKVGDTLFDEMGEPTKVLYKSPRYFLPTYEVVFNTGEIITASRDHIWTVNKRLKSGKTTSLDLTTEEILNSSMFYGGDRPRYSIPFTSPLNFPEKQLVIPPYTLGAWLGDGTSRSNELTCDIRDIETVENIKLEGYNVKLKCLDKRRSNVGTYVIDYREKDKICAKGHSLVEKGSCRVCSNEGTIPKFLQGLKELKLIQNKHIPEQYLYASISQRKALLQGLMDTDGSISKGVCKFTSSIPVLAEGVGMLLDTLGVKYTLRIKKTAHKDIYRINFKAYSDILVPFRMERKKAQLTASSASPLARVRQVRERYIREIRLVDTVSTKCITVDSPSHLFLAGRGLIPTHNTMSLLVSMAKSMDTDPTRMQFTIRNTSDVVDYIEEKVSPFLRGVKSLKSKVQELASDAKKKTRATSINILGGGVTFTGTTASERRSKSVKRLFMDEVSLYAKGTVVELIGRTKAYERFHRKVMLCSSLLYEGDEMSVAYNDCEHKMEWNTWCQECGGYFYAGSKHLKFLTKTQWKIDSGQTEETFQLAEYRRGALKDVYIECPHCSHHISNDEKAKNIIQKKYKFVTVEGEESGVTKGYKVNALGSRISTLETIATTWINAEAEGDQAVISQFFVDWFNEHYVHITDSIEASQLLVLGNELPRWEVPKDTVKIYMGVDSQKDHFWIEVKAFCYGNISHTLWYGRVESFADIEDIWVYGQSLTDAEGQQWMISSMGIDRRGYNENGANRTAEVDAFVEYMVSKYKNGDNDRIYATMGVSALVGDRAFSVINSRDMSSNRTKIDIKILKISNLYMKNVVARAIERTIKKETAGEGELGYDFSANLFYINQEDIEADRAGTSSTSITRQLTSEVFDFAKNPKTGKVDQAKSWVRIHKDNHLWDTSVVCHTFAEMDKVNLAIKRNSDGYKEDLAALMAL